MGDQTAETTSTLKASPTWRRVLAGFVLALTLAVSAYLLIDFSREDNGFSSLWFLAVLPAFLSALICYIGDPRRSRSNGFYWITPVILVALVFAGSMWFLREGVICLIMLSPVWLVCGWIGAFMVRRLRKPRIDPTVFRSSLLLLPLLAGVAESQMTFPHQDFIVTRQIVIDADAATVWPYTVANAHIAPSEGRWTFSQNLAGLPRPRATVMHGEGVGAIRTAHWGDDIHFDEVVTDWRPGQRLAWDFAFTNASVQDRIDRHISPDGPVLTVASGEYVLRRLGPDKTLLILRTRYTAKSHVNLYAAVWGEVFLGDIQSNVLSVIRDRAERKR